jgi:hypothetical protein
MCETNNANQTKPTTPTPTTHTPRRGRTWLLCGPCWTSRAGSAYPCSSSPCSSGHSDCRSGARAHARVHVCVHARRRIRNAYAYCCFPPMHSLLASLACSERTQQKNFTCSCGVGRATAELFFKVQFPLSTPISLCCRLWVARNCFLARAAHLRRSRCSRLFMYSPFPPRTHTHPTHPPTPVTTGFVQRAVHARGRA